MEITQEVIREIAAGDRKVILKLYHYSFDVLMGTAVRFKDHKEDQMEIVNNAFMKIVTKIESYSPGTAYFSWIKTIVQREIIDDFRKNKRYKALFKLQEETSFKMSVEPEVYDHIDNDALMKTLDVLPPATKLVFNLYGIEGYSSKEIMKELDISYVTVKCHIKEARKRLKKLIIENKTPLKL